MFSIQRMLRVLFSYLRVQQRVVLCCFSLLAIINAYTMRLCLDLSLNRIVLEGCAHSSHAVAKVKPHNWLTELGVRLNQTENLIRARLRAGREHFYHPPEYRPPEYRPSEWKGRFAAIKQPVKVPSIEPVSVSSRQRISCSEMWSRQTQTLVTAAFYAGYMLTHVPGGRLSECCGGKWILGTAIMSSAILTLLTPVAVRHGGPYALMAIRLGIGLCEGPTFPAVSAMLAQWVPEGERGLLASGVLSGGEIGITLVQLLSGLVMAEEDWPVAFYVVGGGAVAWFLGFTLICYSKPDNCPYIQSEEREYIRSHVSATLLVTSSSAGEDRDELQPPSNAPWKRMLMSTPLWALISASMQHDWSEQQFAQELQKVLEDLRSKGSTLWDELEASIKVTAPHVGNWLVSLTTGTLSDFLIAERILSRTETRRLMSWLVFFCGSMYMVSLKSAGARIWRVLAVGAYYAGIKLLPLDMSPNYAGTLMGISNGMGALPGLLLPYLREFEADHAIVGSVRSALLLICSAYISAEVQSYNQPAG
ncbi:putative inorganic phosphate cotransporter [Drosophila persimilis]|uniref:Inorganic phosphate cotransporter n=2 Tax=pseudoobscura subgroup TaxID=32358 RepID=A0A6I8UX63_DROPS|nr:putative inorganic phosphate cotransporter [Drosophila persimilis]XP_002132492.3 putative inorganic phosphate cotransporter [Drosophila pseudoobscura]